MDLLGEAVLLNGSTMDHPGIRASTKPERYAYKAITQLRAKNYPVVAVGAKTGTVAGVEFKTSLEQLPIHTVSMYLSPARQEMYYDKIIALQPQQRCLTLAPKIQHLPNTCRMKV